MSRSTKQQRDPHCRVCGVLVPNIDVWRGRIPVCAKEECRGKVRGYGGRSVAKYIPANNLICNSAGCTNYIPEAFFEPNVRFPVCSRACYERRIWGKDILTCAYPECGKQFASLEGYHSYCCQEHATAHASDLLLDSRCCEFRSIFDEYIAVTSLRLRYMPAVRSGLSLFLWYLNEHGITDLGSVTAPTVTDFLKWGEETGRPSVWNAIWPIKGFMNWLIATGRRSLANPVVSEYHRKKKAKRLPRPYTEEQMRYIWDLLDKRGTTLVRLAVSIAEESGLRISEIVNLRLGDLDLDHQRLFVGLPNKTMVEAWVPFHEKTLKYAKAWLTERDASVPHDHVFVNVSNGGVPHTKDSLHGAIARLLCKTFRGRKYNEEGLDSWSTHRLRHLMATRLVAGGANAAAIMAIGRWASFSAMQGYAQVDDSVKARGYNEAMAKARQNREESPKTTTSFRKYVKAPSPLPKAS